MKILVLTDHYYPDIHGGYEVGCSLVCKELIRRGHDVQVLTTNCNKSLSPAEKNVFRILPHSMRNYKNMGLHILASLIKELKSYFILKKFLRHLDCDIVYVWSTRGLFTTSLVHIRLLKVPICYYLFDHWAVDSSGHVPIGWFSNDVRFSFVKKMLKLYYSILKFDPFYYPKITYPQFCSTVVRNEYENKFAKINRPIIHFGIDSKKYHFSDRVPELLRNIVWIGRPSKEKGFHIAIECMKILHKQYPDIVMNVYGGFDREQKDYVKGLMKGMTCINFHDPVPHEKVPEILKNYDILIFSSMWNEPYGLVPLEAMAAGCVVVGTGDGGSSDYCEDQKNCLLYDPYSPEDCFLKIKQLIENPDIYYRIRNNARTFIEEEMKFSKTVDRIESDLRAIISLHN